LQGNSRINRNQYTFSIVSGTEIVFFLKQAELGVINLRRIDAGGGLIRVQSFFAASQKAKQGQGNNNKDFSKHRLMLQALINETTAPQYSVANGTWNNTRQKIPKTAAKQRQQFPVLTESTKARI
jgi:hypothetical protein